MRRSARHRPEPAVRVGLDLPEPRGRIRARRPQAHRRPRDRAAADLDLSFNTNRGVRRAAKESEQPENHGAPGWPLLDCNVHFMLLVG